MTFNYVNLLISLPANNPCHKMPLSCDLCQQKAIMKRPKTGGKLCKDCFYFMFEEEIHKTIVDANLFTKGETVAIGASGEF